VPELIEVPVDSGVLLAGATTGPLPDLALVLLPLGLQNRQRSEYDATKVGIGPVRYETFPICLLHQQIAVGEVYADFADDDVSAQISGGLVYAAKIQTEPIVIVFAIVMYADTVAINTDATILIQELSEQLALGEKCQNFLVTIEDPEASLHRTDTLVQFRASDLRILSCARV
jgi:hypothetical protein